MKLKIVYHPNDGRFHLWRETSIINGVRVESLGSFATLEEAESIAAFVTKQWEQS